MAEFRRAITRLMQERKEGRTFVPPAEEAASRADETTVDVQPAVLAEPPVNRPALIAAFTAELIEKGGISLRAVLPEAQIAALAVSAFDFLEGRGAKPFALRVLVPRMTRDGWQVPHTVVESAMPDCPFIVETLRQAVQQAGGQVELLVHPLFGVRRGTSGRIEEVGPPTLLAARESFVHMHVSGLAADTALEGLLAEKLSQIVAATRDYAPMRIRAEDLAAELARGALPAPWNKEVEEVSAFLRWLGDKSFVFLGYREYDLSGQGAGRTMSLRPGSSLGILRAEEKSRYRFPKILDEPLRRWINEPPLLVVTKTTSISPIHRLVPMDYVGIKRVNSAGTVVGECRFLGLFTSKAVHEQNAAVPVLRARIRAILEREGVIVDSHDDRELRDLFDSFSKTELLASRVDDLHDVLNAIRAARGRHALRVFARPDSSHSGAFVTVTLPGERYSAELQDRVTGHLRARLDGPILEEHVVLADEEQARLHYYLRLAHDGLHRLSAVRLEEDLGVLLRTWDDQLRYLLGQLHAPAEAERLAVRYADAFPPSYKSEVPAADALGDIAALETLLGTGSAQIEMRPGRDDMSALKVFLAGERLVLSDFIPVLENLGLRVFDESFLDLTLRGSAVRIHTFWVRKPPSPHPEKLLVETLHAVRKNLAPNDGLNRLSLLAGLDWRAIDVLRAYAAHARQAGMTRGRATIIDALVANPPSARALFDLFAAKFDPGRSHQDPQDRLPGIVAEARNAFLATLAKVESLTHDRILRGLAAAIDATVRTSFFAMPRTASPAPGADSPESRAVVLKFDCARLPYLPEPRPLFETYVHAPHVEGIHLRAGKVARGGIRLSDRPDDFRTEVLGLMRTQVVKNAVIVPTGAKGAFVVTNSGKARGADVELAYRTFIGGLLSITDNVEGGRAIHPRGLLVYDDADPYLVVAADKGTATFSDLANQVAAQYGFWLGDAFASGGSNGYDHKKEAITARGAWECVRQHFREMGRDVDHEPLTVIGIGDMSGDVFGNGMLRSRTIKLIAAFNHQHIFLDPQPNPEVTYRERERLFRQPGSGWNDFDPACLGPGGGIYARGAKSIPLSPQARAMLGIESESASGEEVVRAILQAEADLLWNGGIGTYVKASDETDADAGDPANDAVRVDANRLRVRVVAEGGNLGFTQRARVEFALGGGRINTDAIDNSGGVDLSDHEVNLKIALQPLVRQGSMRPDERNRLLRELTDEVCERVLRDNRRQARVLSLDQERSQTRLLAFRELAERLEARGMLDPVRDGFPGRAALRSRRARFAGLTRPELAVLLAHTKIDLQRELLDSTLVDDRDAATFLSFYFPRPVRERFAPAVKDHQLRREIIAVELANLLIDTMGVTFCSRLAHDAGRSVVEVAKAWTVALKVGGVETLVRELEAAQRRLTARVEAQCFLLLERVMERAARWLLATQDLALEMGDLIAPLRGSAELLAEQGQEVFDWNADPEHAARVRDLVRGGVPDDLAERLARLDRLADALEIGIVAAEFALPYASVADVFLVADEIVDVAWMRQRLEEARDVDDRWQRRAAAALIDDLVFARRNLVRAILVRGEAGALQRRVEGFVAENEAAIEHARQLLRQLRAAGNPSLPALMVAVREAALLAG